MPFLVNLGLSRPQSNIFFCYPLLLSHYLKFRIFVIFWYFCPKKRSFFALPLLTKTWHFGSNLACLHLIALVFFPLFINFKSQFMIFNSCHFFFLLKNRNFLDLYFRLKMAFLVSIVMSWPKKLIFSAIYWFYVMSKKLPFLLFFGHFFLKK